METKCVYLYQYKTDSCIIANAHFQGHRMGNQGFKGGGICNYTGLQGGKSSKIYALACLKSEGACANFAQSRHLRSDARKVG